MPLGFLPRLPRVVPRECGLPHGVGFSGEILGPDGPHVDLPRAVMPPTFAEKHSMATWWHVFSRCLLGSESLSTFWAGHPHLHQERLEYTIHVWIHCILCWVLGGSNFRPSLGLARPQNPLTRRGSCGSAGCTKHHPPQTNSKSTSWCQ